MIRRAVLAFLVATLLGGVGLLSRPALLDRLPLSLTGDVSMVTSPDGMTTVVTIDMAQGRLRPDGVVDHAFRLQHKTDQAMAYEGPGTIRFAGDSLRIEPKLGGGWLVVVVGKWTALTALDTGEPLIEVIGLSHLWGSNIQVSRDHAASLLLSSGCQMDERGDPSCDSCESGGPGVEACGVECGAGEGCSASCGGASFACCNCPSGCGCCSAIEGWPSALPSQH